MVCKFTCEYNNPTETPFTPSPTWNTTRIRVFYPNHKMIINLNVGWVMTGKLQRWFPLSVDKKGFHLTGLITNNLDYEFELQVEWRWLRFKKQWDYDRGGVHEVEYLELSEERETIENIRFCQADLKKIFNEIPTDIFYYID